MTQSGERIAPHNLAAEESIIGACLLARDAIVATSETVIPDHFYKPGHGHIYSAILALHNNGEKVDPITVADWLARDGLLETVGGLGEIIGLQSNAPAISNAGSHARIVAELATLRRMIGTVGEIADMAYDMGNDVGKIIRDAEQMILEVGDYLPDQELLTIDDMLAMALDEVEKRYESGEPVPGLPTGFMDLDELIGGSRPGRLYVIGARPSMGKTSLAMGIGTHAAVAWKQPTIFHSMETEALEFALRLLSMEARVDNRKMDTGRLKESDWKKIEDAITVLKGKPLFIDTRTDLTVAKVESTVRKVRAKTGMAPTVIIDYLGLMNAGTAETRQIALAAITRGLKVLAIRLGLRIFLCAQLNRDLERRADKRPMLSDLRETGALEQDADVILFPYRDEIYNPMSADQGVAEIGVLKNRHGPTGVVKLAFLGQYTKFVNMAAIPGESKWKRPD